MAKVTTKANTKISTQEDFLEFADSLTASSSKKGKTIAKATMGDIPSLDISKLRDVEEAIHLSDTNIEINLKGDVGVFSAALLSRRYKRKGFAGRDIKLAIPASVSQQDRDLLIERIGLCVKSESSVTVKDLIKEGASITMEKAKELGLIDQVIYLNKSRGAKPTSAVVASDDKPVSENQTATT